MTEIPGNGEKMPRQKRERSSLLAFGGAAALLALAANLGIAAFNAHMKNRRKKGKASSSLLIDFLFTFLTAEQSYSHALAILPAIFVFRTAKQSFRLLSPSLSLCAFVSSCRSSGL